MPTVPTYDNLQVASNTLPQTRINSPDVPDVAGPQAQQMAQGLHRAADATGQIAMDMAQQANQLRVDDALNKAKEAAYRLTYDKDSGYSMLKGINALERPDGKPLADEYGDHLKRNIEEISGTLGNDAQKQAFTLHANNLLTSFKGQAIQHESQEFKTYGLSVSEGVQNNALRDIGVNWNNPEIVDASVQRIRAEVYRQAQLLGKSAEWQEAAARKVTSNAHKVALMSALGQNNPIYADGYLKKYADQMDADDILAVRGHITTEVNNRLGMAKSADVMGKMQPRIQTSEVDRAFNILLGTESNHSQFGKDGKPLTSSAGAVGIAQVMPGTAPEAAKMAGLPWDEARYKSDPEYNKALGAAYFKQQLQDFGGDIAKVYAAYNAGPRWVSEAVQRAEKAQPGTQQADWFWQLNNDKRAPQNREQTRNYVTKNMKEFGAGSGVNQRPTFLDIDNELRADPVLASNPAAYKVAREDASRRYEETTKAIKQQEEDSVAAAIRWGVSNGYQFSAMPVALRAAIPPTKLDDVRNTMASLAKGNNMDNPVAYQEVTANPKFMAGMSESEWFTYSVKNFTPETKKHFDNERAKLTGAVPSANGPGELNSAAIKQSLDTMLRTLKIDPTPKDDGGNDAARVGAIRKFVNENVATAQREAGHKFTDVEVEKHINGLFLKSQEFKTTFLGFDTGSSKERLLTMKAGDIPGAVKNQLVGDFKAAGITNPTDADLIGAYWRYKSIKK